MKFESTLTMMLSTAVVLAIASFTPSSVRAQESQPDATTSVKVSPSTGVAGILVTKANACPNVACASGDTCVFNIITGTTTSFSRFGAGLGKATLLGCMVTNTTSAVPVASGATAGSATTCAPATGTITLTQNSKAAGTALLAFAGDLCTLPTSNSKQTLNAGYVLTVSNIKNLNSATGNLSAGFDTGTGIGDASFSGTKD